MERCCANIVTRVQFRELRRKSLTLCTRLPNIDAAESGELTQNALMSNGLFKNISGIECQGKKHGRYSIISWILGEVWLSWIAKERSKLSRIRIGSRYLWCYPWRKKISCTLPGKWTRIIYWEIHNATAIPSGHDHMINKTNHNANFSYNVWVLIM